MSFRFNPISLLSRRSSKAKGKGRSESADQTSLRSVDDENDEYVRKPRIIIRPSKAATSERPQSTTLRAQVLASLRRARSPRRRKHKDEQQTGRATSVPPAPVIPSPTVTAADPALEPAKIIPSSEVQIPAPKNEDSTLPAPLAKHDSYESTDTVEFEPHLSTYVPNVQASTSAADYYHPNYVLNNYEEECVTPKGVMAQSIENLTNQEHFVEPSLKESRGQLSFEGKDEGLEFEGIETSEFGGDSDEDDDTTEIEVNYAEDDRSVSKLSVEYETEYPSLDHSDNTLSAHLTPKHYPPGSFYFDNDEDATPQPSDSEMSSSTPVSFHGDDDEDDDAMIPSEVESPESPSPIDIRDETTEGADGWQTQEVSVSNFSHETSESIDYTEQPEIGCLEPQFEVESDPEQDPFHAVETAALGANDWNEHHLTTPSIIVTSASSESLRKLASKDAYEPPSRPPPPSSTSTPKRPPPPPSLPPGPPPRPDHGPTPTQTESKKKRKKDKLFGLVDLGPLPSDPDPNFPFRRHFEKSILPNPKKAFQRIVRGETKAERRQRKEQAELNRLLKGGDPKPVKSEKPPVHSKEWEEFQALTARIQSTVQESASKIQALASTVEEPNEFKRGKPTDSENWADFESAFAQSDQTQSRSQEPAVQQAEDKIIDISDTSYIPTVVNFEPDWDQAFAKTDIAPELPETEQEWNNLAQADQSILETEGLPIEDFVPDWDSVEQNNSEDNWANQDQVGKTSEHDSNLEQNFVENWDSVLTTGLTENLNTATSIKQTNKSSLAESSEPDRTNLQSETLISSTSDFTTDWDTVFQTNKPTSGPTSEADQSAQKDNWNSFIEQPQPSPQHETLQPETSSFVDNWDSVFPADRTLVTDSKSVADQSVDWISLGQNTQLESEISDQIVNPNFVDNWESIFSNPSRGKSAVPSLTEDSEQITSSGEVIRSEITESTTTSDQLLTNQDFRLGGDKSSLSPVDQSNQIESAANAQPHLNLQNLANGWDSSFVNSNSTSGYQFCSSSQKKNPSLIQQIDDFLGISESESTHSSQQLISDPIKLLEKLKPKPRVDPFAELGIEIMDPVQTEVATEFDGPAVSGLDTEQREGYRYDDDTDVVGQLGNESISSSSSNSSVQMNDPGETISAENFEEPKTIEEPQLDENSNLFEPNRQNEEMNMEIDNPFAGDTFGFSTSASSTGTGHFRKFSSEELKSIARPRAKPVRQETLSGNNPFRRKTSEEQTASGDELVIAAAGIELCTVKNIGVRVRDSFESADSDDHQNVVANLTDELVAQDNADKSGFDPLQTIYPESDNDDSGSDQGDRAIRVTIKDEQEQKTKSGQEALVEVPILQAPPPRPVSSVVETSTKPDQNGIEEQDYSNNVPEGWVTFAEDTFEPTDDTTPDMHIIDRAFEVTWETNQTSLSRRESELEPIRPDTPDPELDIPFHPPADPHGQWRLWLRYPEKKTRVKQVSKYTTDRYWREIMVTFNEEHGRKVICLHEINDQTNEPSPTPYRTIRIEPYMQLSREKLQQYDKYGKVHVFKLNHVSYKELVGIRPEKFSIKNLQHLVTHKPKQNVAVDHLPVYTEVLKFGSLDQSRIRNLMPVFEDALMNIPSHKDTSLNYNKEEVCCYVIDEYLGKLSSSGSILEQKARTRIFCTAFVNGGPHLVLGLNDKWRYGREIVRRSDILPVMHDEWISIRNPEFHSCVQMDEYEKDHMLKFYPLDGCRFELLRFRVSLRSNRELPMQIRTTYSIDGRRVSMRCDLLVPGFFSPSKRSGAVPCEDVEIHIPVPEEWIYHFRVEKHHKYGSVHSTLRKPGKIKGLERITQMAQSLLPPSILEASIGLAKYEHLYKAIVWRIPRVPDKSEASLRPHLLSCNLVLAPHDSVPEWDTLIPDCQVEYTMPSSTVSGATVRSISVETSDVVEKFVKYTTKYKYSVEIDYQLGARKEPTLKSLFDDSNQSTKMDSIPTPKEVDKYEEIDDTDLNPQTENSEQPGHPQESAVGEGEVVDLLGLGDEFFPSSTGPSTTNADQPAPTPSAETTQDLL